MMKNKMLEASNDKILQDDLEYIANSDIDLEDLKDSTILVTGATGLIGSQIVKALLCCNRTKNTNIRILALVRDLRKANYLYGPMLNDLNFELIHRDILKPLNINKNLDYIIHAASVTSSKDFVTKPVETIETIVIGTKNILELAKIKKVKGLVYLSSMEVFGITNTDLKSIKENDLGYIDILSVRSSYSESKRMAETLCISYKEEYKVPIKIARLAQTFGPGISYEENRIFAQIARNVINSEDIILHTNGESIGNYCYTRDSVIGILMLITRGKSGEAYIISNENSTISIKDMANMVAEKLTNNKISVVFDIPESSLAYGYAPNTTMRLNPNKMKSLGWKAEISIEESFRRMISSMKEQIKND